jgi:hypothetical protein
MEIDKPISTKYKELLRFFKLERAAENIPSVSILIASLYRNIGLSPETEKSTNIRAQELYSKIEGTTQIGDQLSNDDLKNLFNTSLSIPTSTEQDKKKKFFITPFVPEVASFGLSSRNTGSPWNPGGLLIEIIANYSSSKEDFMQITESLYDGLSVQDQSDPDWWSIFISRELKAICKNLNIKKPLGFQHSAFEKMYDTGINSVGGGSNRFKKNVLHNSNIAKGVLMDLKNIIKLKSTLTRQKWLGILEAFLRLTLFNHLIYTMTLSRKYYRLIEVTLKNSNTSIDSQGLDIFLNRPQEKDHIRINLLTKRTSYINTTVRKYCYYNNILFELLKANGFENFEDFKDEKDFLRFTNKLLAKIKDKKTLDNFMFNFKINNESQLDEISEIYPRTLKNIKESLEYLCSKKPPSMSNFIPDVNYIFNRKVHKGNAPYEFEMSAGLISTLTCLIFLKVESDRKFMSGLEFVKYLKDYNIELNIKDISEGELKNTMQSLGIIIDSPDTEGGVLILKPGWV